jgi:putative transposase
LGWAEESPLPELMMRHDRPPSSPLDVTGGFVSQEGGRVKRSRFDETQILSVLREQEAGSPLAEVCHRHGISEPTFYRWKSKYYRKTSSDSQKLSMLEDENRRLKKALADLMLEVVALKERLGPR